VHNRFFSADELKPLVQHTLAKAAEARAAILKKDTDVDMASADSQE
jgi:hypothetical protein